MPADDRWPDARLDDLHSIVRQNSELIRDLKMLVTAHDLQLIEIERERRSRLDQRFSFRLATVSVLIGQAGTIATILITHH